MEANLAAKSQSLKFKENGFILVSKEFENYKLRTQSILKQSKDKTSEKETKKKENDLFALEEINDVLNDKIKSMSLKFRTVSMKRNVWQNEQNRLMERFSPLLQNLELKKRAGEKEKENIKNKATFLKQDKKDKTKPHFLSERRSIIDI